MYDCLLVYADVISMYRKSERSFDSRKESIKQQWLEEAFDQELNWIEYWISSLCKKEIQDGFHNFS